MKKIIGEVVTIKKERVKISKDEDGISIELNDGFDSCYERLENSEVEELIELLIKSLKE